MVGRVFLGRYQTTRLLGEGGMGRVYLARQLDLGRQVVVKVMHDHLASDPQFRERFLRETLLMARFQHPYAVTLYDASLDDPQGPCIIMEHVRGVTLEELLSENRGRLSPGRVARLLGQLCEVLQAAHSQGIIHRDLKPANLMVVDADTPYEKLKVMDFGLAKMIDPPSLKDGNGTGLDFAVGTPTYISPEQVRGEPLDHRCDLYSVGVVLYQMLAGRAPFDGASTMEILLAHATEVPRPLVSTDSLLPISAAVQAVVFSCLAKSPSDRPASARDLSERYLAALTQQEPEPQVEPKPETPIPSAAPSVSGNGEASAGSVQYHLEAWMPQTVAIHKLRGFMTDVGGEVIESIPGRIRVRLGGPGTGYQFASRRRSWLGMPRTSGLVEMNLLLQAADAERHDRLRITVSVRPLDDDSPFDPNWRAYTAQIFCDLRGYLMGQTGVCEDRVR